MPLRLVHPCRQSILHVNGCQVFLEDTDEEGEGGAIMVSAVVRAPPTDIFKQVPVGRVCVCVCVRGGERGGTFGFVEPLVQLFC